MICLLLKCFICKAFTALKELHTRVDGLPVSPSPATTDLDTVITPKPTSGSRSCDGVVVFQVGTY